MNPKQGDMFGEGRRRRDEGIRQVLDHVNGNWATRYGIVIDNWFLRLQIGEDFAGEDLKRHAEPIIGKPHHPNAWSAEASARLRDWQDRKRIVQAGMGPSRSASNHAHCYRRYRKIAP